jgi:choline-sulfatase
MLGGAASLAGRQSPQPPGTTARDGLKTRPNIILFMPDELRADSLACYGNPVTRTPNFDRLAAQGTRFANCHVQFPVCGASRCSMLTGWPTSVRGHRSLQYFLRPEEPNLFRYLKRGGYDVFWYGKNDALAANSFLDSVTEWSEMGKSGLGTSAFFGGDSKSGATPGSYSFLYPPRGERTKMYEYALIQAAIDILNRKESDKPFCIFLPLVEPHPPYTAPKDFYEMYDPGGLPPLAKPDLPRKPSHMAGMRDYYGLRRLSDQTFRKIRAVYYGQVSYTDWLLGELLEAVEKSNHEKDTAIFVMSDHGDYAGDFGLVEKWTSGLEDCLTHVPLIVKAPGGATGVQALDMVELFDVMQTCLDLGGVEAQHTHFARSLFPQMRGGAGDRNRAAFAEGGYNIYEPQCFENHGAPPPGSVTHEQGPAPQSLENAYNGKTFLQTEHPQTVSRSSMVRTREHKLIVRPQGQCEMYSYASDPLEENNLYGDSSVRQVQDQLQQRLLYWYVNTTGIAPFDQDPRGFPPSQATRKFVTDDSWHALLDTPGD